MFFWDSTMLLLIPAIILMLYAQQKVKSTYAKYSAESSRRGKTGKEVAQYILQQNGLGNIPIEVSEGKLSDHYDPVKKILRLSGENYGGQSIAALGIAAHEVGHAIQHDRGYAPLNIRNTILPAANFGSTLAFPLFIGGFLFSIPSLIDIGIILFSAAVIFQIVTLPVEFDASKRAVTTLQTAGILEPDEIQKAKKVLNAAALTYVAAAAVAVMHLIRLIILRGSRD
ncbi:zinc metallopeptidase [bacterium]|nr:zinc metallopeptidase [bacterium]